MTGSEWDGRFEALVKEYLPEGVVDGDLPPDLALIEAGMDSMAMIGLSMGLEAEYGLTFPEDSVTFDTFATPRTLWLKVRDLVPQ